MGVEYSIDLRFLVNCMHIMNSPLLLSVFGNLSVTKSGIEKVVSINYSSRTSECCSNALNLSLCQDKYQEQPIFCTLVLLLLI